LRGIASWKVSAAMLVTLLFVMFTYLFAAESFTKFLYPDSATVAFYFQAAALPRPLFDALVASTTLLIVLGWFYLYSQSRGRKVRMPAWAETIHVHLYLLFLNRLYTDAIYGKVARTVRRAASGITASSLKRPL
jgi:NADH-quinone oxidoreductase subunit L